MPRQLSLNILLQADATFANYWLPSERAIEPTTESTVSSNSVGALSSRASCSNAIAVKALLQFCRGQGDASLLFWGSTGCGLSHLLQACSHESNLPVAYLPLKDAFDLPPEEVCENLEHAPLVCIDDLDALAGHTEWEQAFFHLYNRIKDKGHRIVMATHVAPHEIPFTLPDLHSRVMGSVIYHIDLITRGQKVSALKMRARERGMLISDDVAAYVVKQNPRHMKDLFATLDRLDTASLQAQKKLSLRFVKHILGQS